MNIRIVNLWVLLGFEFRTFIENSTAIGLVTTRTAWRVKWRAFEINRFVTSLPEFILNIVLEKLCVFVLNLSSPSHSFARGRSMPFCFFCLPWSTSNNQWVPLNTRYRDYVEARSPLSKTSFCSFKSESEKRKGNRIKGLEEKWTIPF